MLPEKRRDVQDEPDIALPAPPDGKNGDRMYRINRMLPSSPRRAERTGTGCTGLTGKK